MDEVFSCDGPRHKGQPPDAALQLDSGLEGTARASGSERSSTMNAFSETLFTHVLKEYFILKFCQFNKRTCHFISSKIIS